MTERISSGDGQMSARKTGVAVRRRCPSGSRGQVDVDPTGQGEGHDQRRRREVARARERMDPALEVAVARQDGRHDQVVGLDRLGDRRVERAGVADAGRAAVAGEGEAEGLERGHQPGRLEVAGDRLGARRERGLDRRRRPAGRARRRSGRAGPAPTMTVGLDVFVHEVIAAMATEPVRIVAV